MKTITKKTIAGLVGSVFLTVAASAAVPTNPPIYYNADQSHQLTDVNGVPLFRDINDPNNPAGVTEIGDEITFAANGLRQITDLQYNFAITPGSSPSAQLFLRALDGPLFNGLPSPGSTLYTGDIVTLTGDANGYGSVTVNNISGFTMPDTVAWSVVFTGVASGNSAGLLYYDPPNVGTSADDFWAKTGTGWQLLDTPNVVDNFAFAAYAVPEPATWAIMLGGFGLLGLIRRRKS